MGTSWHLWVYGTGLSPDVILLASMDHWSFSWLECVSTNRGPCTNGCLLRRPCLRCKWRSGRILLRVCSGLENWVRWREVMNVEYWRSFQDLENFARNPSDPHFETWKGFNQRVAATNGSVRIWPETF